MPESLCLMNPNVDVALDVDINVGSLDVLDDVVNVEVVPMMMTVLNEVCDCRCPSE